MIARLKIVVVGLSLSSSWGNGHATTYRALLRALHARGHDILFLECDRTWYAQHRDMPAPEFCRLALYDCTDDLQRWKHDFAGADLVIVGSYVVDGVRVAHLVRPWASVLAFYDIDTPVTLAGLARGETSYISADSVAIYDLYLSFTGGPTLHLLENVYGAKSAHALYCAVDPLLYRPAAFRGSPTWQLGYLGTYSPDRQPALEKYLIEPARRAKHLRFVVAGPQYPEDIEWPENVERFDHLPPSLHADFYNSLGWTLNITRADMIHAGFSPSVRLFEAAACGTPILSDDWPGLSEFLADGSEIVLARSCEQVLDVIQWPRERALEIGDAARQRVMAAHTAEHRALTLENLIRSYVFPKGTRGRRPSIMQDDDCETICPEGAENYPAFSASAEP